MSHHLLRGSNAPPQALSAELYPTPAPFSSGDDVVTFDYPQSGSPNGGKGTDTLVVDWSADANNVSVSLSADGVRGGYDGQITDAADSAAIQFTSFERFSLTTGSGADALAGGDGADTLDGGAGADVMAGGGGDDLYTVDNVDDVVSEASDGGVDTVRSSIKYTLGAELENLTLTGDVHRGAGNALANVLTANDVGDSLNGLAGADTLIGGAGADSLDGGRDVDRMEGGGGDDTYHVNTVADVVVEAVDGGVDLVISAGVYTLPDNVENLTITGSGREAKGFGNDLANVIHTLDADAYGLGGDDQLFTNYGRCYGGDGDDTLTGGYSQEGGLGNDVLVSGGAMHGQQGDDTYVITDIYDRPVEDAGQGVDTAVSAIDFTLPANIENLRLTGTMGVDGIGNALDNVITGSDGDDVVEGGAGGDTLDGGAGMDTASYLNAASAVIVDLSITGAQRTKGEGQDLLVNIENLSGSKFADLLAGNDGANAISGGDGDDTLSGGAGDDTLVGGAGHDRLVGGRGADHLTGGDGDTFFYGSVGTSTAKAADVLTLGDSDVIDLSAIDADTTTAGDQAFHRVTAFTGHAGEFTLAAKDQLTTLQADVNGDKVADFVLYINGSHADFANLVL